MSAGFGSSGGFGRSPGLGGQGHLGDALSALLDGELSPPVRDAAEAHLADCAACREELLAVRQARAWVRALPVVEPPASFYERILRDRTEPVTAFVARPGLRRRAGLAAVGAAAAAVIVLGVGSPSPSPVSPAVPRFVQAHATGASVGADVISKLAPVGVPVTFGR